MSHWDIVVQYRTYYMFVWNELPYAASYISPHPARRPTTEHSVVGRMSPKPKAAEFSMNIVSQRSAHSPDDWANIEFAHRLLNRFTDTYISLSACSFRARLLLLRTISYVHFVHLHWTFVDAKYRFLNEYNFLQTCRQTTTTTHSEFIEKAVWQQLP